MGLGNTPITSLFHMMLLHQYFLEEDRNIARPTYLKLDFFNLIKRAMEEGVNIVSYSLNDRYEMIL